MDSCETASIWTSWCTFGGQVTGLPNQSIGCSARLHSDSELATASIVYTLASPLCDLASDSHGHRHTARRRVGKRSLSRATGRRRNGEAQAYVVCNVPPPIQLKEAFRRGQTVSCSRRSFHTTLSFRNAQPATNTKSASAAKEEALGKASFHTVRVCPGRTRPWLSDSSES